MSYLKCRVVFIMLSVIILSIVILGVIILSVVILGVIILSVVMLGVITLSVVMLSVVASSSLNCCSKKTLLLFIVELFCMFSVIIMNRPYQRQAIEACLSKKFPF